MSTKPTKALAKAFADYNANAKANQTKPMQESRLALFALLQTLANVPAELHSFLWDIAGDRTQATSRFRSCVEAVNNNAKWVCKVRVPDYCVSRSASPRWENTLREAVKSYYSLEIDNKAFIVVPDKVDSESAFIVRIA